LIRQAVAQDSDGLTYQARIDVVGIDGKELRHRYCTVKACQTGRQIIGKSGKRPRSR
jgi:hypothetical protein